MGSCAAPSAKGDDKFITTDYLQQCQSLYTGRTDEFGQIEFALRMMQAETGAIVGRIGDASNRLSEH
ncbi:hypothetical protein, partial [Escherichia coli]|uniref:hypothetical protein n=1 Tax=Escherichia coli TaxID=562 RepID=UPI001C5BB8B6